MANRNSRDALGTGLISQQFMLIKLLAVLPNHLRAEIVALGKGVHVNHVDAGAAKPTASALGKRKARTELGRDDHHNLGWRRCYYCIGEFNHLDNIYPHNKVDCPKRKLDQSSKVPVFRRNILKPGFKTECDMNGATQKGQAKAKVQGKAKAKAKAKKERPSAVAQLNVPADAVHADTPASSSLQTPGSSDLLDVEPMDTDELMSEFDIGANAGHMEMAREISTQLNQLQMSFEDKTQDADTA
ncbi:hypothetical protein PR003_g232 [Phytophthora rubi]|uniref:Uncharacterized protein n=1 Tax=Phytophthora rubi TaxID=129364 RepID=A0A6A4G4S8_9STRA|nr:hypothetical protein PR003_g232 [Phytophthora rubi]